MKQIVAKLRLSLRTNLDFIFLVVVLQYWQDLTKSPLNLRTALTVAGLYLLSRLSGVRKDSSVSPEKAKREFVDDPEKVLEVAKLTGYEALRGFAPYLDKWMKISGKFDGVGESLEKDGMHLSILLIDGRRVNLRFAMEHERQLRALRPGQRVTVIGQIQQRGLDQFAPINCEFVRAEPLRLAYAS
jgi:hypothetical protein